MKIVKALFFLVVGSWLVSCGDSDTIYYDLPPMLNMTKAEIVYRLGEPEFSRKMKEFNTTIPEGPITIPSETTMDTYTSHGYVLRIYYILDKCEKPVNFFLYRDDNIKLDSAAIVKLKSIFNLKDTTQLPKSVYQKASEEGYSILNIECR